MERRPRKSANREYNLINTSTSATNANDEAQTSYVIPTTNTSMAPAVQTLSKSFTKDAAGFNQYQMPQYRNTRQRTNNAILQQKTNPNSTNTDTAAVAAIQRQTTAVYNKSHNVNQAVMGSKAAACIASPMEQLAAVHAKATSSRNKNEGKQQFLFYLCMCEKVDQIKCWHILASISCLKYVQ